MPFSARSSRVDLGARERHALGRALHFDDAARPVITTFMSVSQAESSTYSRSSSGVRSMMPTDTAATGLGMGDFICPAQQLADGIVSRDVGAR